MLIAHLRTHGPGPIRTLHLYLGARDVDSVYLSWARYQPGHARAHRRLLTRQLGASISIHRVGQVTLAEMRARRTVATVHPIAGHEHIARAYRSRGRQCVLSADVVDLGKVGLALEATG